MLLGVQRAVASSVTPGHSDLVSPGTGQGRGEVEQRHQKQRNSMLHTLSQTEGVTLVLRTCLISDPRTQPLLVAACVALGTVLKVLPC